MNEMERIDLDDNGQAIAALHISLAVDDSLTGDEMAMVGAAMIDTAIDVISDEIGDIVFEKELYLQGLIEFCNTPASQLFITGC